MAVELSPKLQAEIQQQVDSGRYPDANAVLEDAVALLADRERQRQELRQALAVAERQIAEGHLLEWTPELRSRLVAEARARAARGETPKPEVMP